MILRRTQHLPSDTRGAALLAALCFALVLAIVLSSYITMCFRSLQMSARNANSGHSVELAETGMEEALWALHNNDWTGWAISGHTATKTLTGFTFDSNVTGSVSLSIANYDGTTGTRTLTVTGMTTLSDGTTQSRTLTSTSAQAPLFVNAIAATGDSTTTYNGVVSFGSAGTVDSYDSTLGIDPASTPNPGRFSAVVTSKSNLTSAATVQMTNVAISGYIATMPGSAGVSYSTSATLDGLSSPVSPKIDTNRETTSPYQPVFDVITPAAPNPLTGSSQTIGTAGATTPTYYYYSGNYYLGAGSTLTVNGPVVIVISGYLWTDGTALTGGKINVASTGSLTTFVRGGLRIDGGGIVNATKLPKNVAIFGQTGNNNAVEFGTTVPFYGVIYMPEASMTFANNPTYYGALVAQSVTFGATSSPTFHYDTSLRNVAFAGIDTPYAVANVRETTNP